MVSWLGEEAGRLATCMRAWLGLHGAEWCVEAMEWEKTLRCTLRDVDVMLGFPAVI
jgi:hypothetical protein